VERVRKYQPLASEVDIAARKGDIAWLKQLQQSDTTGIIVIITIAVSAGINQAKEDA
jgi:hypothetical protein